MKLQTGIFAGLLGAMIAAPAANAAVLYTDGNYNGKTNAYAINFGFQVADSFSLSSNSVVMGADIVTWNIPGDSLLSVDWTILSGQPGSAGTTTLYSGTASPISIAFDVTNTLGYNVWSYGISLGSDALAAGTYWLELDNAVASNGDPIYWDENGGPSAAWQNVYGNFSSGPSCATNGAGGVGGRCSETFDITGAPAVKVPEPSSLGLMASGLLAMLGMAFVARRRGGSL